LSNTREKNCSGLSIGLMKWYEILIPWSHKHGQQKPQTNFQFSPYLAKKEAVLKVVEKKK